MTVIVLGVLPRKEPNVPISGGVLQHVQQLNLQVEQGLTSCRGQTRFVDCFDRLLVQRSSTERAVATHMMPDQLHPNATGHKVIIEALEGPIRESLSKNVVNKLVPVTSTYL